MEMFMQFKDLIKEMRLKGLYSQKELADLLGTDQTSISYYERGARKPSLRTIRKAVDEANKNENLKLNIKYSDIEIQDKNKG